MARKSSRNITLVIIGMAALAGCSEEKRDMYASREDCLADWGNKPEDCVPANPGAPGNSAPRSGIWYGPSYSTPWWRSSGSHFSSSSHGSHAVSSVSSHSVTRGGFGSTGHSSSGG
jgi:uncharacterized protein YgiB involved in biofilm formation